MKAVVSLVLVVALIGGIYMLSSGGCNARAQVAGNKLLEKIDSWLGELNVKRQEIQNRIDGLDQAIQKSRQGKIGAEVRMEQFDGQIASVNENIERVKQGLAVVSPHLSAEEDVEINGRMMSPTKINELSQELLSQYESLSEQLGTLEATRKLYQQTHDLVSKEYETSIAQMSSLKKKLEEIDIKKKALDDMRTAQTILGESGSISDEFAKLESEINDLFVDVETGIRMETEKIDQRAAANDASNSALEEVLGGVDSAEETKARIDAILGTDNSEDEPDE